MLRLRPYKKSDADYIISWLNNEDIFSLWGGERFGQFPITSDIINEKYFNNNGDCVEDDNFYPLTAVDDNGPVGHFIIRYPKYKEAITGYGYEPWHVRYVGVKAATEIMEREITLEEYLGIYDINS